VGFGYGYIKKERRVIRSQVSQGYQKRYFNTFSGVTKVYRASLQSLSNINFYFPVNCHLEKSNFFFSNTIFNSINKSIYCQPVDKKCREKRVNCSMWPVARRLATRICPETSLSIAWTEKQRPSNLVLFLTCQKNQEWSCSK
jgi:hypothetical protein